MRLVSVKRAPPGSPRRFASDRAARRTRLSRPAGTDRRDARDARPRASARSWRTRSVNPRGARLTVSVSWSEIDWNTVTRSWKPSARLGPTARQRFSLACAWTVTVFGAAARLRRVFATGVRPCRAFATGVRLCRAFATGVRLCRPPECRVRVIARCRGSRATAPRTRGPWPGSAGRRAAPATGPRSSPRRAPGAGSGTRRRPPPAR